MSAQIVNTEELGRWLSESADRLSVVVAGSAAEKDLDRIRRIADQLRRLNPVCHVPQPGEASVYHSRDAADPPPV